MPKKELGYLSIKIDKSLRDRVVVLARQERRTLGSQACILLETGISVVEGDTPIKPPLRHWNENSRPLIDSLAVLP